MFYDFIIHKLQLIIIILLNLKLNSTSTKCKTNKFNNLTIYSIITYYILK